MREEAVERLRGVVRDSVGKHLYTSAIFLADKVAAATGDPADVYMLAQALFLGRHYRRALHVLNNARLLRDLRFRFLAAKCLVSSTPTLAFRRKRCVRPDLVSIPLPCVRALGLT
jgi:anaphase-promoting complex subunit 6